MSVYTQHVNERQTPQFEPIPGKAQVQNSAGGYSFAVDDWVRLERFLILGNEGGSYYASEQKMTVENAGAVRRCIDSDPARTVQKIVEISESGRAPKNDPAIFALAMASRYQEALDAIPRACRTGTHLFQFVDSVQAFRGFGGRSLRRAVAKWYTEKTPKELAYQLAKYRQRGGWTHHDVLHKCHAKPPSDAHNKAFQWVKTGEGADSSIPAIDIYDCLQRCGTPQESAKVIRETQAVREWVKTEHLNSPDVWDALLESMPMTAMVRNLGKMGTVGLLTPMSAASQIVTERLSDDERIRKSRIHPLALLMALSVYQEGRGFRGSLSWAPDSSVVDALDGAFYKAFQNVQPSNKRHLLALDVSGSMGVGRVGGSLLSPRVASAAMAMVAVQTEPSVHSVAFSSSLVDVPLSKRMRLDDALRTVGSIPMGGTDCALPMLYALKAGIETDVFVVYTDSETWFGRIHPCQALQRYREQTGIPAKLIVVGMVSNGFSIADPDDGGMMDVIGFDVSAPSVMSDFANGRGV